MNKLITACLFVFMALNLGAQAIVEIKGKVMSTDGKPLVGVNIVSVENQHLGTVTDFEGKFILESTKDCIKVKVQMVGFATKNLELCDKQDSTITLRPQTELDEVVIEDKEYDVVYETETYEERIVAVPSSAPPAPEAIELKEMSLSSAPIAAVEKKKRRGKGKSKKDKVVSAVEVSGSRTTSIEGYVAPTQQVAGQLTAGEWNDLLNWEDWKLTAAEDLASWQEKWQTNPGNRYSVLVKNSAGYALPNARVELLTKGNEIVFVAKTDNTGRAELWSKTALESPRMRVEYEGKEEMIKKVEVIEKGENKLSISVDCPTETSVDVAFVVDATGSMSDEITYLQAELADVIKRVQEESYVSELRTGSVFYRDHQEEYLTIMKELSTDHAATLEFIGKQHAAGGGDRPEAVEVALEVALKSINWNEDAVARILFFLLDAPPHETPELITKMNELSHLAAEKGVRIVPIMASGADGDVEFLMRSLALTTNGRFLFLTDDSGIGNAHAEPSVGPYTPSFLNDLMHKVVVEMMAYQSCKEEQTIVEEESKKNTIDAICFPNPTKDYVFVQINKDVERLVVLDMNGKEIWRQSNLLTGTTTIGLQNLSAGVYFLRLENKKEFVTLKVVVIND